MAILPDGSAASSHSCITDRIEPGSHVITDGWNAYRGIGRLGYTHEPRNQSGARRRGADPGVLPPGVHRVASAVKRWLLGTHQGSVTPAHLGDYLAEFVFRFNRCSSPSRGMLFYRFLELGVGHVPVRYRDIVDATPKPAHPARHARPPAKP